MNHTDKPNDGDGILFDEINRCVPEIIGFFSSIALYIIHNT